MTETLRRISLRLSGCTPLLVGCASLLLVLSWQALTVKANYAGNWTSLFHLGDRWPVPPELASETLFVHKDAGYDGTFYHLVAHDPWFGRGFTRFVDNPSLRWRRILLPGLSHIAALGEDKRIHACYIAFNLLFVFLGSWWLARFCVRHRLHPVSGFAFLLVPAVLVSVDRLTIDTALSALTVGVVVCSMGGEKLRIYGLLALCPLARETGVCIIAGKGLEDLRHRDWKHVALSIGATLPVLAWTVYVSLHATRDGTAWLSWPLAGLIRRTLNPVQFAVTGMWVGAAAALDYLALFGMWVALVLVAGLLIKRRFGLIENSVYMLAFAAMWLGKADIWGGAYEFGRTMSPLFLLLGMLAARDRNPWFVLPVVLVLPRILLQFEPQVRGITRSLLG